MSWQRRILNLLVEFHTKDHCLDVSPHICKMHQLLSYIPWLVCNQGQECIQLEVQNFLCEMQVLSHMHQPDWYEMKRHYLSQMIPLSDHSIQTEKVSLSVQFPKCCSDDASVLSELSS